MPPEKSGTVYQRKQQKTVKKLQLQKTSTEESLRLLMRVEVGAESLEQMPDHWDRPRLTQQLSTACQWQVADICVVRREAEQPVNKQQLLLWLQTDNHASTSSHISTGRMLFLSDVSLDILKILFLPISWTQWNEIQHKKAINTKYRRYPHENWAKNTIRKLKWNRQTYELLTCVCVSLCTNVIHNTAYNSSHHLNIIDHSSDHVDGSFNLFIVTWFSLKF